MFFNSKCFKWSQRLSWACLSLVDFWVAHFGISSLGFKCGKFQTTKSFLLQTSTNGTEETIGVLEEFQVSFSEELQSFGFRASWKPGNENQWCEKWSRTEPGSVQPWRDFSIEQPHFPMSARHSKAGRKLSWRRWLHQVNGNPVYKTERHKPRSIWKAASSSSEEPIFPDKIKLINHDIRYKLILASSATNPTSGNSKHVDGITCNVSSISVYFASSKTLMTPHLGSFKSPRISSPVFVVIGFWTVLIEIGCSIYDTRGKKICLVQPLRDLFIPELQPKSRCLVTMFSTLDINVWKHVFHGEMDNREICS